MFYNKNGILKVNSGRLSKGNNIDLSSGVSTNKKVRKKPDYFSLFKISQNVITQTKEFMVKMGQRRKEGLVFWSGHFEDDIAYIKTVIKPHNISSSISAKTNNKGMEEILHSLRKNQEFLFMQVHSHPQSAFHSSIDCDEAISFKKGFISIVVPFYGITMEDVDTWAIYEYSSTGIWRQLSKIEVSKRLEIQ